MTTRVLRAAALLIAVIAIIDPAITADRRTRPAVALIVAAGVDAALADRVARQLADDFTVVSGAFAGAAATVVVGHRPPHAAVAGPVFAVIPDRAGATVTIERVNAPSRAVPDTRVPVTATTHVTGAAGHELAVTLHAGDFVMDRVTRAVPDDDAVIEVELEFLSAAPGPTPLRVTAELHVASARVDARDPARAATRMAHIDAAAADIVVAVGARQWAVLFYEPRPSWLSTFVRRPLERDPRFLTSSRTITSRDVSTAAGQPPAALDDPAALARYDVIIVGAPDALSARDVAGLEHFLRRRAGSVVLLFDRPASGPITRLTGAAPWLRSGLAEAAAVHATDAGTSCTTPPREIRPADPTDPTDPTDAGRAGDAGALAPDTPALRAADIARPATLSPGSHALATIVAAGDEVDTADGRIVVWRSAVGAGRLVVSGALDAWRYRDPARSSFDRFWQTTIAAAAAAAPPPIDSRLTRALLAPGELTELVVTLREATLADLAAGHTARAIVAATLETPAGPRPLRLWPDDVVGRFRAAVRAPREPGTYALVVSGDGVGAEATIIVADEFAHASAADHELLDTWTTAHGGRALPATRLASLSPALERTVRPPSRRERWHPMRAGWWILPFTLALGGEWWLRRRRGQA